MGVCGRISSGGGACVADPSEEAALAVHTALGRSASQELGGVRSTRRVAMTKDRIADNPYDVTVKLALASFGEAQGSDGSSSEGRRWTRDSSTCRVAGGQSRDA